jgi:hypothetical protein
MSSGSSTCDGSPGSTIFSPAQAWCTIGATPAPDAAGDVSTWAISPIVAASPTVPGTVAKTYPGSVSSASATPISRSSSTSSRERSSCFSVEG